MLVEAATVLGLAIEEIDDPGAVRRAWRSTALVTHPDAGGTALEFAKAADAYRTLCAPRPEQIEQVMTEPTTAHRWVWSVQIRWPIAIVGTTVAGLLIVLVVVSGAETVAPLVVYLVGWGVYGWWHAAGRPRRLPVSRRESVRQ